MTATESAWKKFLKLKKEVPVAEANVADSTSTLKRKRETVPEAPIKPKIKQAPREVVSQKTKKNRQKKKSKAKSKRHKEIESESKAARQAALEYLTFFTSARSAWKFSKQRQNYLLKHAYDEDAIPEVTFPKLLSYLNTLQGGARQRCIESAKTLIERFDKQAAESTAEDKVEPVKADKAVDIITEEQKSRAVQVRDTLSSNTDTPKKDDTDSDSDSDSIVSSGSDTSSSSSE